MNYLVAAYAVVWLGLFIYLALIMLRIRGVRTELAAIEELVHEHDDNRGGPKKSDDPTTS
jgi:CcmD family protein